MLSIVRLIVAVGRSPQIVGVRTKVDTDVQGGRKGGRHTDTRTHRMPPTSTIGVAMGEKEGTSPSRTQKKPA